MRREQHRLKMSNSPCILATVFVLAFGAELCAAQSGSGSGSGSGMISGIPVSQHHLEIMSTELKQSMLSHI